MNGFILKIRTLWDGADRTQRLIAIFGSAALVGLLVATYAFASKPKMSLVFSNLDPADTGNITMEIDSMGIPVDYDAQGNVRVPSDKVAQVRAGLAMKGKLPRAGSHSGSDALSKMPFIVDPNVQKVQLKGILESELADSIQFFDGVDSANVQVTMPVDSPFEGDKKPAQANVTISEKAGSMVTTDEANAMANLVASAVPGLDKNKVTIFTRTGRALWDGQESKSEGTVAANKLSLEKAEAHKKSDEIQKSLDRMLGPGNAIAMVNMTLDVDEHEKTIQNTDPSNKPLEDNKVSETMVSGAGAAAPAPTGQDGNTGAPAIAPGGAGGGGNYVREQKQPVYGSHTTEEHFKYAAGGVQTMSVTILVNQPTGKTVVNPTDQKDPIVTLAKSFLPPLDPNAPSEEKAAYGSKFAYSVVAYPFDTKQADDAKKAESAASTSGRMQQILSILPIAALLLVAFFVIKSIGKLANRPLAPMLASAGGPSLGMSGPGGQLFAHSGGSPRALESANSFVLPEIVKQKALEAGISEEQLQAAIEEAGEAGITMADIPSIKSKVNVPLEQIKKMANERPETVAMLIKSWLIEEGIRR